MFINMFPDHKPSTRVRIKGNVNLKKKKKLCDLKQRGKEERRLKVE